MKLVLLDLDKTLIDESYNLTDSHITTVVQQLERDGIQVGLCSDSPLATLQFWCKKIAATGPIVFERGAGIFHRGEKSFPNRHNTLWFPELRANFVNCCLELLPEIGLFIGDAVQVVRNKTKLPHSRSVLINGLRECSFSFHVIADKKEQANELLKSLGDNAEKIAQSLWKGKLDVEINKEYLISIIHADDTRKKLAVQSLMHRFGQVYFIGDSLNDYVDTPGVVQCAVANASANYKAKSALIASKEYTKGVIEILEKIWRNKK
ncbi:HAD family phosphatase [Candidatus Parcubacteria bacterium]|nr:MAG: HAD family phosphatase [Candidatus Parcubacteria bacterium]